MVGAAQQAELLRHKARLRDSVLWVRAAAHGPSIAAARASGRCSAGDDRFGTCKAPGKASGLAASPTPPGCRLIRRVAGEK